MTPMKQIFVFGLCVCLGNGCTTVGPEVTSPEVQARKSELDMKAAQYRTLQLQRVEAIAKRLIEYMPEDDRQKLGGIHYEIAEQAEINAYAGLGGRVGVTLGMLRFSESEDELAVILAHELAHLTKGHVVKGTATGVVASAIGIAAGSAIGGLAQDSTGMISQGISQGISRGLGGAFSRDFEREADYFGFQFAYTAGFDIVQGAKIWDRFAIEAPKELILGFFSTHPSSAERSVRAEKIYQEFVAKGVEQHPFLKPSVTDAVSARPSLPVPGRLAGSIPISGGTLSAFPSSHNSYSVSVKSQAEGNENEPDQELSKIAARKKQLSAMLEELQVRQETLQKAEANLEQEEADLAARRKKLDELRLEIGALEIAEQKRLAELKERETRRLKEQQELERILQEAKEAAIQQRYEEFGILETGLAKKVTNLLVGKSVEGQQNIFSVSQGKLDWYCQYRYLSKNSWKALGMMHRKYRAYWYSPDSKLFAQKDFIQSKLRAEFAKTSLEWEPLLGEKLVGVWTLRVFEGGKLVDERTFELARP